MTRLSNTRSPQSTYNRRFMLDVVSLACVLAGVAVALTSWARGEATLAPAKAARLVIDFGDGVEWHFTELPWTPGTTGLDLLLAAKAHPHGIQLEYKGSGSRVMVNKINSAANEGGGAQARNWLYWIDDGHGKVKKGEVSAGVHQPQPGDTILWKFATFDTTDED